VSRLGDDLYLRGSVRRAEHDEGHRAQRRGARRR
jgi:hypothetical protein